ncbi:MAG TPA: hypothetical protein VLA56_13845 [Pseudomonadales bacterium]|nr:hypothetical protein [Pseudomonadales bacterium]
MKAPSRAVASTLLGGAFVALAATGLIAFATPYDATLAGIHTLLGATVLVAFVLHMLNNWRALLAYLKVRRRILVLIGAPVLVAAFVALGLPPATTVLETGYALRRMGGVTEGSFLVIRTHTGRAGPDAAQASLPIRISVRAGAHYESDPQPLFLGLTYTSVPQMAFWIEAMDGTFVDTLYVTRKLSAAGFLATNPFDDTVIRRPEALPVWSHRRGVRYGDGLAIPLPGDGDLDGVTAPTPLGHYDLLSAAPARLRRFRVLMEVNRSYDFNAYWHPRRFPDDPVYSGSGASGQPSLVYAADIDLDAGDRHALLRPIGRGHHSGRDGSLTADLSGMDSALELVGPVLVEVKDDLAAARPTAPITDRQAEPGIELRTEPVTAPGTAPGT